MTRMVIHAGYAVLLCLALAAPGAAQDNDEPFRRGLDARGDRKWQDVVTQMRIAIENDPKESTRKVRGGLLRLAQTEYLPYFFLGEALFNLNECAGAVEAWSVSEQQRAVSSRQELTKQIQDGYRVCASKGVLAPREYNQLLMSTRRRITEVTEGAQRIRDTGQTRPDVWSPQFTEQFERARNELVTANSRLALATRARSATDFADASAAADRASGMLRSLDATLNAAIDNLTSLELKTREIEALISTAEAADREIESVKALPPVLAATRASGRDLLTRSRTGLQEGVRSQNVAAADQALKNAQDAAGLFTQVLDEIRALARGTLERRLAEAVAVATEAFSFVDTSFATLDRLTAEKPSNVAPETADERDKLWKQLQALRRRFDRARGAEDVRGIQETARLTTEARTQLDALIKSFGPVTLRDRGVHAGLEAGARAFFGGEYQAVLTALDSATMPSDVPLRLHVHLFRAAALYALYVRAEQQDQSLLTQALAEVDQCKELNATFVPDARAFGPRFIDFFQRGAQPVAPAQVNVATP